MTNLISPDPRSTSFLYLYIEMDINNVIWKTENGLRSKIDENSREYKALKKTIDIFGTINLNHVIKEEDVDVHDF